MLLTLLITLPLLLLVNGQIVVPTSVNSSAVTGPIPTVTIPTTIRTPTPSVGGVTCYTGTDNTTTCFGMPTIPLPTTTNPILNGSLVVTISAPSFSTGPSGSETTAPPRSSSTPQLTTKASPTSIATVIATSQGINIRALVSVPFALACIAMGIFL